MDTLVIEITGGIIAGLFLLIIGVYVERGLFRDRSIFSVPQEISRKESYKHLEGKWNGYWLTRDPAIDKSPFWMYGEMNLKVSRKNIIEGELLVKHPSSPLEYVIHGEVRSGRMLLVLNCVQDPSDFVTDIFPNVFSSSELVGIWAGSDWQRKFTVAPIVYSRKPKEIDDLRDIAFHVDTLSGALLNGAERVISG